MSPPANASLNESLAAVLPTPNSGVGKEEKEDGEFAWSDDESDSSSYNEEDDGRYQRVSKAESEKGIITRKHKGEKKRLWKSKVVKYRRGHMKFINQYEIRHKLGEGSFASVRLAFNITTNRLVAVKKMKKEKLRREIGTTSNNSQLAKVRKGLRAVLNLQHQNLLRVIQVLDPPSKHSSLYVVLEFAKHGQLMEWDSNEKRYKPNSVFDIGPLGGMTIQDIKRVMAEAVEGLYYMHGASVTHGDIKPDNILISEDLKVKLCDFGSSRVHKDSGQTLTADGTYPFWSPEMAGSGKDNPFDNDTWALSVCLYCMTFGDHVFYEPNTMELLTIISTTQITPPPRVKNITPNREIKNLLNLIKNSLALQKTQRLDLEQIREHQFLRQDPLAPPSSPLPGASPALKGCGLLTASSDRVNKKRAPSSELHFRKVQLISMGQQVEENDVDDSQPLGVPAD